MGIGTEGSTGDRLLKDRGIYKSSQDDDEERHCLVDENDCPSAEIFSDSEQLSQTLPKSAAASESTASITGNRCSLSWNRVKGISLALASAVCFSSMMLIVKLIEDDVHAFEICLARMVVQGCICVPYLVWNWQELKHQPKDWLTILLLFLRCLIGTTAFICAYYSVTLIPLGDASAIIFCSPVIVTLLGCVFLGEKCSSVDVLTVLGAVTGGIFVAHPDFLFDRKHSISANRALGIGMAVCACTASAITFVIIRRLKHLNAIVIVFFFSLWGTLQTFSVTAITGSFSLPTGIKQWVLLSLIGIIAFIGQVLLTKAFQIEKAGLVSVIRTSEVVWAFILEATVLRHTATAWSLAGAGLILAGVGGASIKKLLTQDSDLAGHTVSESQPTEDDQHLLPNGATQSYELLKQEDCSEHSSA